MKKDDIIRLAREAGIPFNKFGLVGCQNCEQDIDKNLERFAELVEQHLIDEGYRKCAEGQRTTQYCGQLEAAVAAEREACARLCDAYGMPDGTSETAAVLANAIRARGKDIFHCPECGGPADNGHDRCIPPNPYWCTKCMEKLEKESG